MEVRRVAMEFLTSPRTINSEEEKLAVDIVCSVVDLYFDHESQMAEVSELTIPTDDLMQDRLFRKDSVDEYMLEMKKSRILNSLNSIISRNEELTQDLLNLQSKLKKL